MGNPAIESENRTGNDRRNGRPDDLARDLSSAIERGEIELTYQPQFATADGRLVGAEALVRWQHPFLGRLAGDRVFAMAERTGQGGALSRRVAQTALADARAWPSSLRLSLNVTAADLAGAAFDRDMAALVAESRFAPERLTLEITEGSLVADVMDSAQRLQRLTDMGIHIALDDFGAGFCNFQYLKLLPLHGLKLDRSMVVGIDENQRDLAVLRGIIAMAHALDLEVLAEGIERASQLDAIVREGCTSWQGYLGGASMDATAFARLATD